MTRCITKTHVDRANWWVSKPCSNSLEGFEGTHLRQPDYAHPSLKSELTLDADELTKTKQNPQSFLIIRHRTYWPVCFLWQKGSSQHVSSPDSQPFLQRRVFFRSSLQWHSNPDIWCHYSADANLTLERIYDILLCSWCLKGFATVSSQSLSQMLMYFPPPWPGFTVETDTTSR